MGKKISPPPVNTGINQGNGIVERTWSRFFYSLQEGVQGLLDQWSGTPPHLTLGNVPQYANNAAAITGGLVAGDIYRTGGNPDTICIVH